MQVALIESKTISVQLAEITTYLQKGKNIFRPWEPSGACRRDVKKPFAVRPVKPTKGRRQQCQKAT